MRGIVLGIVHGEPVRITGQPAIHCFRIAQEALNNAAKHAETKTAEVEMIFEAHALTLSVRYFGRGILQAKQSNQFGIGVIAMRERSGLLGGSLSISSTPGAGTTVTLVMPLRQEDHAREIEEHTMLEEILSPRS